MVSLFRITPENPVRELGYLDYERCAALHNEILRHGWIGSGKPPKEFRTWWEVYSPSADFEARIDPYLSMFLKRAHVKEHGGHFLFYWISDLAHPESFFQENRRMIRDEDYEDRLIYLYSIPSTLNGSEKGLMFDQQTSMAFYVPEIDDMSGMYRNKVGWHPLEVILDAYLQTIDEGKISTVAPLSVEQTVRDDHDDAYESDLPEPDVMNPWYIHTFTEKDRERAITAFNRLIDAIERRLPKMQPQNKNNSAFPWPDATVLKPIGNFPRPCFAYEFLKSIIKRPVKFRYIAPGINLPAASDISEYLSPRDDENFLGWRSSMEPYEIPVLLFPAEGEDLVRWPHHSSGKIRAGLYLTQAVPEDEISFGDACILALPFGIGAKGWARQSNGLPVGLDLDTRYNKPKDSHVDLYQSYGNGFNALHCVQLYKVLENWAHRVEDGDWDVGENGVLGGPEKFKDADTEEHWYKYWIPPSW